MELFYALNSSKDDFFVDVWYYGDEYLEVEYQGKEYKLPWWPQYGYYRGEVNGIEGYVL